MAVLLNELFFPKIDPHSAALLSAFAFCSTYVLRPFGALIFGYIGDHMGRKPTVIITTMMMSVSCIVMANLPTYEKIGMTAGVIMLLCRMAQGLSSMSEIIGAQIYVTEITKPPIQYPAVSFISLASSVGSATALGVAFFVTHFGFNWRIAFWIGSGIAITGTIARTVLRESKEFTDAKTEANKRVDETYKSSLVRRGQKESIKKIIDTCKISRKTKISYFLVYCGWPVTFYLAYMYFNPLLKEFGYTTEDIILHNFLLSIVLCATNYFWSKLSYTIHPLNILKYRTFTFILFSFFLPSCINASTSGVHLFIIQSLILLLTLGALPADSIFVKGFSVLKRFTWTSWLYALTRAVMYVFTSFGLVYLTEWFGHYGLWVILFPIIVGYLYGVNHFEKLYNNHEGLEKREKQDLDKINDIFQHISV
jgi:MFS family permease